MLRVTQLLSMDLNLCLIPEFPWETTAHTPPGLVSDPQVSVTNVIFLGLSYHPAASRPTVDSCVLGQESFTVKMSERSVHQFVNRSSSCVT